VAVTVATQPTIETGSAATSDACCDLGQGAASITAIRQADGELLALSTRGGPELAELFLAGRDRSTTPSVGGARRQP
jgi:hypothetical protein